MNNGYLKEIRLMRHLTQQELADKVGVSRVLITHFELGIKMMTVQMAVALAEALEVPVMWLIKGIGNNEEE